ncbi:MAG: hypothetical protein QOG18_1730 [Microbacteriaceae bacterium]|jgi:hypothetical protein|nr:hypothetical protein [Microbacteriaceae bacterium]MCU1582406.1 hypothetical protein [Microbacteriaceae bacterium]MDQ1527117.1 hypothetical protein [Microbacteriaceae bacterium]MDQ1554173.1 hypothetical protein [Microbacteriaceae bacterium]MDQ1578491.1 hypothetical protein [Microbacteriaceae bacterium]
MAYAHIVPSGSDWIARVYGQELSRHDSQQAAWDAACDWLKWHGGGELSTHAPDGTVSEKNVIFRGNDPRNIRG